MPAFGTVDLAKIAFGTVDLAKIREGSVRRWRKDRLSAGPKQTRTIQIRAGHHVLTAEDPLPPDLRDILSHIK